MKPKINLRKQVAMYKSQVEAVQKSWTETNEELGTERGRRYAAERELENIRKQFVDLKERLHRAELENARNEGYLQRVREDDNVRDPLVTIEGPEGKRMISKRHPMPIRNTNGMHDYVNDMYGQKPKHWVNY